MEKQRTNADRDIKEHRREQIRDYKTKGVKVHTKAQETKDHKVRQEKTKQMTDSHIQTQHGEIKQPRRQDWREQSRNSKRELINQNSSTNKGIQVQIKKQMRNLCQASENNKTARKSKHSTENHEH